MFYNENRFRLPCWVHQSRLVMSSEAARHLGPPSFWMTITNKTLGLELWGLKWVKICLLFKPLTFFFHDLKDSIQSFRYFHNAHTFPNVSSRNFSGFFCWFLKESCKTVPTNFAKPVRRHVKLVNYWIIVKNFETWTSHQIFSEHPNLI